MSNLRIYANHIILREKTDFLKINLDDKSVYRKSVFKKDGSARDFKIYDNMIFCKDFCDFYCLDLEFTILKHFRLGKDLTTDICGFDIDENNIYVSIRNGNLCVINRQNDSIDYYKMSEYSSWDLIVDDFIYMGLVSGELLIVDKNSFTIVETVNLHKKNLRSLLINEDKIYTASQDLSMKLLNRQNYDQMGMCRNVHRKMFSIVGKYKERIITTSYPCNETKIWKDFKLINVIKVGSWDMVLHNNYLFFINRKNQIGYLNLDEIDDKILIEEYNII